MNIIIRTNEQILHEALSDHAALDISRQRYAPRFPFEGSDRCNTAHGWQLCSCGCSLILSIWSDPVLHPTFLYSVVRAHLSRRSSPCGYRRQPPSVDCSCFIASLRHLCGEQRIQGDCCRDEQMARGTWVPKFSMTLNVAAKHCAVISCQT